jgi:hypothetical protein
MSILELSRSLYYRKPGAEEEHLRRPIPRSAALQVALARSSSTASARRGAQRGGGNLHEYRLVALADEGGCARQLEFRAQNLAAAMVAAEWSLSGYVVEFFEDDQFVAKMRCSQKGFWVLLPGRQVESSRRSHH